MTIENLTLKELREINDLFNNRSEKYDSVLPWQLGKKYFIRTVTMYLLGELIHVTKNELVLDKASWVADTGRFSDALKTGELSEIEPFVNSVILNRDCIIDATIWNHDLPTSQK